MAGETIDVAEMTIAERQATIERLATALERNAQWAGHEGDDTLEMVLRSVGIAMMAAADELALRDTHLTESVVLRALGLLTAFHCCHPQYPVGLALH